MARLTQSAAVLAVLPPWFRSQRPDLNTVTRYLIFVVGLLAFLQLAVGKMRLYLRAVVFLALAIGPAGIGFFVFTGSNDKLMPYSQLLAACSRALLITVVVIPRLSGKLLILPNRGILAVGTFLFAFEGLYVNLSRSFG